MGDYFLGEIRMFAYTSIIPSGWLKADGSILQINQYQAVYALLGATYGGDGRTTFALPDLRGRLPIGITTLAPVTTTYATGAKGGAESVQLTTAQTPMHTHSLGAVTVTGNVGSAVSSFIAAVSTDDLSPPNQRYLFGPAPTAPAQLVALGAATVDADGGSAAHPNMQPFAVVNYCICVTGGIWPPRQ